MSDIREAYRKMKRDRRGVRKAGNAAVASRSKARDERLIQMSQAGLSIAAAAQEMGVSEDAIRRRLDRMTGSREWPVKP